MLSNAQRSAQGHDHEYQSITPVVDDDDDLEPDADGLLASKIEEENRHKGVYLPFWALGAGVLLTWNALLCTIPLLTSFFPIDSSIRPSLASYISTTYCFGNLFFLGAAQRQVGKVSPSSRLHWSLLLSLLTTTLLAFPLLPLILPRLSSTILLIVLSAITILFSLATAYLQSAVFALASLWGSKEMLAVMSGQGGIAVLVSLTQLLLALLAIKNPNTTITPGGGGEESVASTTAGVGLWALGSIGTIFCIFAHKKLKNHQAYHDVLAPIALRTANADIIRGGDEPIYVNTENKSQSLTMRVFWKNLELEVAVAWVFVITLAVLPAITTTITSTHTLPIPRLLRPDIFIPLHFVIFNIGDYIGRTYLPAIPSLLIRSPRRVLLLSFSRTIFIPLLLACNTPRTSAPFFNSDLIYFLIILCFSMTNGWIGSLCMILSSSPSLNPKILEEEKDIAGTLAAFCLVAGLAAGSVSSFAVTWAVGHL